MIRSMVPGPPFGFGFANDISMSHQFRVSIDSGKWDLGTWTKVAGLTVNFGTCQYRPGDATDMMTFPGIPKYSNVKLSRAACSDSKTVQEWLVDTAKQNKPISAEIQLINSIFLTIVGWELKECYPVSWSITEFDATNGRPAVESLELAHTAFLRAELELGF